MLQASSPHVCTCKDQRNKLANKQRSKQSRYGKHAKNKLAKMPNRSKQTCEAHEKGKEACYQTKGGVLGGQM